MVVLGAAHRKQRTTTHMSKRKNQTLPLRSFAWSSSESKTAGQELVEETVLEWYAEKHREAPKKEIEFVNANCLTSCHHCGSADTMRFGKTDSGIQVFKCKSCSRKFNALTNTPFDSRRIPMSEWVEFLLHLIEFHTVRSSAFDNRNAHTTGKYWLEKTFMMLEGIQDAIVLRDRVWIDEKELTVVTKELKRKPDGRLYRGISRNKICVACAVDSHGNSVCVSVGAAKLTSDSAVRAYGGHIAPGSTLVHDDEPSHKALIDSLGLRDECHPTKETKGLADDRNPLRRINRFHFFMGRFFASHGGYDRKKLQGWLNLFWLLMNKPTDRYEKALFVIERGLRTMKKLRYRTCFNVKKGKKSKVASKKS